MLKILTGITEGQGKEATSSSWRSSPRSPKRPPSAPWARAPPTRSSARCATSETSTRRTSTSKRCPALSCKELIAYYIDPAACQACMICCQELPGRGDRRAASNLIHVIDQENVHEVRHLLRGVPRPVRCGEEALGRARSASPSRREANRGQKEQRDMSGTKLQIDGREVEAREGMTVLDAAQLVGIEIPTLCHHEKLEPFGGCRLCIVEVEVRGWPRLVAACVYPVEDGLVVRTRSEKIDRIRKMILELLLAHAPDSPSCCRSWRQRVRGGQGPLREGGLVLHPLRPVRPVLRRGQEELTQSASSTGEHGARSASSRRSPPGSAGTARSASRSARRRRSRRRLSWSRRSPSRPGPWRADRPARPRGAHGSGRRGYQRRAHRRHDLGPARRDCLRAVGRMREVGMIGAAAVPAGEPAAPDSTLKAGDR